MSHDIDSSGQTGPTRNPKQSKPQTDPTAFRIPIPFDETIVESQVVRRYCLLSSHVVHIGPDARVLITYQCPSSQRRPLTPTHVCGGSRFRTTCCSALPPHFGTEIRNTSHHEDRDPLGCCRSSRPGRTGIFGVRPGAAAAVASVEQPREQ